MYLNHAECSFTRWKLCAPNSDVLSNRPAQLFSLQQMGDTVQDGGQASGLEPQDRRKLKTYTQLCYQVLLEVLLQFVSLALACNIANFGTPTIKH